MFYFNRLINKKVRTRFPLCPTSSTVGRGNLVLRSVLTLGSLFATQWRSPLSTEFWKHCVLNSRTQCRALPWHQNEEMEYINLSNYLIPSSGYRTHNHSVLQCTLVTLCHDGLFNLIQILTEIQLQPLIYTVCLFSR